MPLPTAQAPVQTATVVSAWQPPPPLNPAEIGDKLVQGGAAAGAIAITAPLAGGVYSALTLAAVATLGGPWYARFEYATSADGYVAYTFIGNGAVVASGQLSTLGWPLGPLDGSLTYRVRATPIDQSGAPGVPTTMSGTFRIGHVTAPTATAPADAALLDSTIAEVFSWTFNDPDGGAQTAYALRRVRAADGVAQWWRASDASWQAVETYNVTATTNVSVAAGQWSPGGYTWAVSTKDALGLASPYSTARSVALSAAVPATITTPVAAGNLTTQGVTVAWTVAEQVRYRVRLLTGGGFTTVLVDSGIVADAVARSYAVSGAANGTTVRIELTTYNADGLGATVTRDKPVVYTGPTAPTAIGSGLANPPRAHLVITNPGGGDTFASNSVYRSDDGGATYALVKTGLGASPTWDDVAVAAGATYSYKVRAYGTSDTFTDSAVI